MNQAQPFILNQIKDINVWRRGDERAPHKPLLILLALSRIARGGNRLASCISHPVASKSLERRWDEVAARIQQALCLATKKEADHILDAVTDCIEATLLNYLGSDGFNSFWQVLGEAQGRNTAEDPFHRRGKADPAKAKDPVREFGGA
jgi:hypothetical protein